MLSFWFVLTFSHLLGLALGVGAATVKLTLLLKCNSNYDFVPVFIKVTRLITHIIIFGLILLTLSGIGWVLLGTSFTPFFITKLVLVVLIWILGPYIDNAIEPKFIKLAPPIGESPTKEFVKVQKKYLIMETIATMLFYAITIMGVLL